MTLKISGASDDLVEVDGDITEEFDAVDPDGRLLVTSTGHVFRIRFGRDGWEIRRLAGLADNVVWSRDGDDDVVEIPEIVDWVVCADTFEQRDGSVTA